MSLGPSQGRFQFLPRPKIVAGWIPLARQAGEEEGHTSCLLGIPDSVPRDVGGGGGRVPLGVDRKLVKQVQDKSLASSDVFVFLFS